MRRWFRQVLPPTEHLIAFAFAFLAVECLAIYEQVQFPGLQDIAAHGFRDVVLLLMAFSYGMFRSIAKSPFHRSDYRDWLLLTPWRLGLPLPLGPMRLVIQDLLVVAFLVLLGCYLPTLPALIARIPFAFLYGYLLSTLLVLMVTRLWAYFYLLAFGLALVPALFGFPFGVAEAALVFLYLIAFRGTTQALKELPLIAETFTNKPMHSFLMMRETEVAYENNLGIPFDQLRPHACPWQLPRVHGLMLSLLGGVMYLSILNMFSTFSRLARQPVTMDELARNSYFMISMGILISFGIHLVWLTQHHLPPMNLAGRLKTGRLLIPRYDRVWSPFLGIATILSFMGERWWVAADYFSLTSAAGYTLSVMCILVFSPDVTEWRLTSPCRIQMGYMAKQNAEQLAKQKKNEQQLASS